MVMETMEANFLPGKARDVTMEDSIDGKVNPAQVCGPVEPIKFGVVDNKHVANGAEKEDLDHKKASNFPKDAVDEWPAPKKIHTFYLVKFRSYEDPKLKTKLDQADKEIQKYNQARFQLTDALKEKRSEKSSVISQLKPLTAEDKGYRSIIDEKRKEMEPYQTALGKLRTAENARKSGGLCSSEQELNDLIKSLHFRLQHESNTISEEKQLLKDIKHFEGTREKVIANAAEKAKIGDSFGKREDMLDQVKQIGGDLDLMRKDQLAVRVQIKKLEDQLQAINDDIKELQGELANVDHKRGKAYDTLNELRKARDESNACFYQNRSILNSVKTLAAKKDIVALEELCYAEVEKFMSQYNSNKAFRDDYERRVFPSFDGRQMCKDGRMRNPDEKPIIPVAVTKEAEPVQPKATNKKTKEDAGQTPEHDKVSSMKSHKEEISKSKEVETKQRADIQEDSEPSIVEGKSRRQSVDDEVDAAKIKELKREEEIAKAKAALERKKKLAERAEAKAAIRAQKEAEKKLKEKEKKARKKAGASAPAPDESLEMETTAREPEPHEHSKEAVLLSKSTKEQKDNTRYKSRQRSSIQPPKPVLRRKKSTSSYWMWALPVAALSLALLMLGCYFYYLYRKQQMMN